MAEPLTSAQRRELKGRAQRLEPAVKVGRAGITEAWLRTLDHELQQHELVKVRFADLKEERKTLAPEIAERSASELVTLVGNVAVYFRPKRADAPA